MVRIFFVHHVTWSVNWVCHFLGSRRFDVDDQSTNVFWLALPSFGESWHHNHHAFPRSAAHGLKRWELDPSAPVIAALEKVGTRVECGEDFPERQAEKVA
ncbi:MAG TPA: acyl-CoA desaturase [Solirubrobacterales bacterium]|nr:acyl-CoA desaturase [Solirubrobacterales bacterium]